MRFSWKQPPGEQTRGALRSTRILTRRAVTLLASTLVSPVCVCRLRSSEATFSKKMWMGSLAEAWERIGRRLPALPAVPATGNLDGVPCAPHGRTADGR